MIVKIQLLNPETKHPINLKLLNQINKIKMNHKPLKIKHSQTQMKLHSQTIISLLKTHYKLKKMTQN